MNDLLLDTHVFLWWCDNDKRLGEGVRGRIEDSGSTVYVSAVSAWEIALKHRIGKLRWPFSEDSSVNRRVEEIVEECGFVKLPLDFRHAEQILAVPRHHGDPFDHILIAQAQVEGLEVATSDRAFTAYDVPILWA